MSIHINAKKGAVAETVLLPGDPLRAKWIAEPFPACWGIQVSSMGSVFRYKEPEWEFLLP